MNPVSAHNRTLGLGPRPRVAAAAPRSEVRPAHNAEHALSARARAVLLARAALSGHRRATNSEAAAALASLVARQMLADPERALAAQAGGLDEERALDLVR